MEKLRLREAPGLAQGHRVCRIKLETKPRLLNSHSWGLFCLSLLYPLLLSRDWVRSKRLGVNLGPCWMVMGRNGAGRGKGVPTNPNSHSAGRAVSNYPGGREGGCLFGCKNPSFQHLWAEVTFLSPFELSQASSPFPLILRSKMKSPAYSISSELPFSVFGKVCVWGEGAA